MTMWIVPLFFFYFAIYCFLSIPYPGLLVRWGRSGKGPPMSVGGRVVFGSFCLYVSLLFVMHLPQRFGIILKAVYIILFFVACIVYLRDRRNFQKDQQK
jgi:hypothetical protein